MNTAVHQATPACNAARMEGMSLAMQELEFGMDSDPPFDPGYLSASWDYRGISGFYVLSEQPAPQSMSAAAYSGSCSPPTSESRSSSSCSPSFSCSPSSSTEFLPSCPGPRLPGLAETEQSHSDLGPGQPLSPAQSRGQRRGRKLPMSCQSRRNASEREKMRMRTLAEAMHTLREYLPPGYSAGGHSLTKVQTLRCCIRYIKELTAQLGAEQRAGGGQGPGT
ncbi:mesogenin-1 [Ambystoma mexicanum]|uniref:mesogenin-1 n=1 Tax=Ambystoma mexicanum TaxID=8296 RepID=UPI0037E99213